MQTFVSTLAELEQRPTKVVEIDGESLLVVRTEQTIYAVSAFCPHRGAPLADGYVVENMVICPWHRSTFDLCSGSLMNGASQQALKVYSVIIDNGAVYVEHE